MFLQMQFIQEYSEILLIGSFLITMKGYPVPEVISVSTNAAKKLLTKTIFITELTIPKGLLGREVTSHLFIFHFLRKVFPEDLSLLYFTLYTFMISFCFLIAATTISNYLLTTNLSI